MLPLLPTNNPDGLGHRKRIAETINSVLRGQAVLSALALADGVVEPDTMAEGAVLFVDLSDGYFKIKFSDGVVVTLTPDSVLTGTATVNFGSISAGALTTTNVTVTGALVGDPVAVGVNISPSGLVPYAQVTSSNTVSVGFINATSGAIDPASATFKVRVFK